MEKEKTEQPEYMCRLLKSSGSMQTILNYLSTNELLSLNRVSRLFYDKIIPTHPMTCRLVG